MAALDEGLTRAQTLELSAEIRLTQREKAATGHATRRASTAAAQAQRRAEFRLLPMPRHCVRRAPPRNAAGRWTDIAPRAAGGTSDESRP